MLRTLTIDSVVNAKKNKIQYATHMLTSNWVQKRRTPGLSHCLRQLPKLRP
jgi:hypothetical protein